MRKYVRPSLTQRAGLSLIEVSVSTVLVGLIMVAAMRCLTATAQTGQSASDQTQAMLLAEQLMEEILLKEYSDPDDPPVFGPENGEGQSDRSGWDDVDDYHNWIHRPPVDKDGTEVADERWTRRVLVQQVRADDPETVVSNDSDTGVRRITVSVDRDSVLRAQLVCLQTKAWISAIPRYSSAETTGQLPPGNEPPVANIAGHVTSGTTPLTVSFDGRNSSDPEDAPLEFEWDFGNGTRSTDMQAGSTFVNTTGAAQVYRISLTVKDIHGATDTATTTVTVLP